MILFRALLILCLFGAGLVAEVSPPPSISGVSGRVVTVKVDGGFESVMLERRVVSRAAGARFAWRPLATKYPRGRAAELRFFLADALPQRLLRVSGSKVPPPPPAATLTGLTNFSPQPDRTIRGETAHNAPSTYLNESDLFLRLGDRLVFYNEMCGLQIFDVSKPSRPLLTGALRMAGNASALHLLGDSHAVLLEPPQRWGVADSETGAAAIAAPAPDRIVVRPGHVTSSKSTEIVIADVRGDAPQLTARVLVEGDLIESRVVGKNLYLATKIIFRQPVVFAQDEAVLVSSIDLADPAHPVSRSEIQLDGRPGLVLSTDRFFVVAHHPPDADWRETTIELMDTSSSSGAIARRGSAVVNGNVARMSLSGEVLCVLTWARGVRTFSVADPSAPAPLGRLDLVGDLNTDLAHFDGDRIYLPGHNPNEREGVIFVIDTSDPSNPVLAGQIPKSGEYPLMHPLGDRLFAMSAERGRPLVSLFDVSDARAPRLLHRVALDGYGFEPGTESWNKRLYKFFPEKNLMLVSTLIHNEEWWDARVQVLDLHRDKFVPRGIINHPFSPARAISAGESFVAIAPTRMIGVNARDRDHPRVTSDSPIARRAKRIFAVGDFFVRIDSSAEHPWEFLEEPRLPMLNVTKKAEPEIVIASRELINLPVLGSTLKDGVLYIAQGDPEYIIDSPAGTQRFVVSAYDLARLPTPHLLGSVETTTRIEHGDLVAHWPSPGILVWEDSGSSSVGLQGFFGPGWHTGNPPLRAKKRASSPSISRVPKRRNFSRRRASTPTVFRE